VAAAVMISFSVRIRLRFWCNLIFFAFLFYSCTKKSAEIKILWTDERAAGISIPLTLAQESDKDIVVRLVTEGEPVPMIGNFSRHSDEIIFEPLIPFTRGLRYEILSAGNRIGEIKIPEADIRDAPELLNIYPTQDTVPENLLKIYLQFSRPMREGVSAQHIILLQNDSDTVQGAFLDLQPELLNEERTTLTLWLDPGRIKRDLIPNRKFGTPLKKGNYYTLIIDARWKDTNGLALLKPYRKNFFVSSRDSNSPTPEDWKVHVPLQGSAEPLHIDLSASLNYSLLMATLNIKNEGDKAISGKWKTGAEEKTIQFFQDQPWDPGTYTLEVETRLEDLAGNNINRLFDEDIRQDKKSQHVTERVRIEFKVISKN
jgi:hypothetical protein